MTHDTLWPLLLALFTVPVMIWQWRRARREAMERLRAEFQRRVAQRVLDQLSGQVPPTGQSGSAADQQ